MIWMTLLVQHLVEATNGDGARPHVTGGPSLTPIELTYQTGIPTYRGADQEGRTHSLIQFVIEEQTRDRKLLQSE
jgi:hypothetical protein